MRSQRLSYGTAGLAASARVEPAAAPRQPPLARVPAGLSAPLQYGRTPAQARQRRVVVASLVAAHGVAILGLLGAGRLREAVVEARPILVTTLSSPTRTAPPRPLPPPPSLKAPTPPPLTLPVIALETSTAPSPVMAQPIAPTPPAPPAPAVDPTPAPAAPAAPRIIPASGVQFLVPPAPVYSRLSARMHESGKAIVRVFIDEAGVVRNVQLAVSTGFSRLDESALAAVRAARFKPYLEDGVAIAGWACVPIEFELPT